MSIPSAFLLLALAACGGGGGGGGGKFFAPPPGSVTEFSGRLSDVSQRVTVAPRYAHVRFGSVSGPVDSRGPAGPDAGLTLDIDPPAGTIKFSGSTIGTDTMVFDIDFDDDSQAFASDTLVSPFGGPTKKATLLIPGAASGFHYTSYGMWSRTSPLGLLGPQFDAYAFFFGAPTPTPNMPGSGQAVFTGTMRGSYVPSKAVASEISGNANLTADFAARSVTGAFTDIAERPILAPPGTIFAGVGDIAINATISRNGFTGTVTGGIDGGSGTIEGGFFGPGAEEMGGAFRLLGTGEKTIIGAFAARR